MFKVKAHLDETMCEDFVELVKCRGNRLADDRAGIAARSHNLSDGTFSHIKLSLDMYKGLVQGVTRILGMWLSFGDLGSLAR
eukprot:4218032-Pyramimonas_sp.AAC.1